MRWWWRTLWLLVWTHGVLARRAGLTRSHWWLLRRLLLLLWRLWHAIALVIGIEWLRRHLRVLQFGHAIATPVATCCKWWRSRSRWRRVASVCSPLWTRRTTKCTRLVCLRVHILWERCTGLVGQAISRLALEQGQACLDVHVGRIKVRGASVSVERVARLVVARLVLDGC